MRKILALGLALACSGYLHAAVSLTDQSTAGEVEDAVRALQGKAGLPLDEQVIRDIAEKFEKYQRLSDQHVHTVWRLLAVMMATNDENALKLHDAIVRSGYERNSDIIKAVGYVWGSRRMNDMEERILNSRFAKALEASRSSGFKDYSHFQWLPESYINDSFRSRISTLNNPTGLNPHSWLDDILNGTVKTPRLSDFWKNTGDVKPEKAASSLADDYKLWKEKRQDSRFISLEDAREPGKLTTQTHVVVNLKNIKDIMVKEGDISSIIANRTLVVDCGEATELDLEKLPPQVERLALIGEYVTKIGDDFLDGCKSLTNIDLSGLKGLETIGHLFLYECENLTTVNLDGLSKVTSIGDCFLSGTNLKEVNLNGLKSLKEIGSMVLSECKNLTAIDCSDLSKVTLIGDGFLSDCTNFKEANLSGLKSLISIGDHCLAGCPSLKEANLSGLKSLTSIGGNFLSECTNLEEVTAPADKMDLIKDKVPQGVKVKEVAG